MYERILYQVIASGITWLGSNRAIFDDLFVTTLELEQSEADEIWTWWQENTPSVYQNYPRRDFKPPFYSIVLGQDAEDDHVIGDSGGMITDEGDPRYGQDINSSFWANTLNILCITEHPDATLYIYHALKYILMSADDAFVERSWYEIHMAGQDLEPDPRFMPEHWFIRLLALNFKVEFQTVDAESALGKAWKVAGIHVDKAGAPGEDVGGVKTQVYPVVISEE